ncbi:hypothetical protein [Nonomuraea sp. NPDC003804]|uniref:MmyB family transcriptional regulator n=1 Tax=Nonomuraea sp. NPDC003804 TaxID=3154547 RepID=UPI0033A4D117
MRARRCIDVRQPLSQLLEAPSDRGQATQLPLDRHDLAARTLYVEWPQVVAATAAQLRHVAARHPDDRELAALIKELTAGSTDFRTHWVTGEVALRTSGTKSLRHPEAGVLTFTDENFEAPGDARQRLVAFTPGKDSPTEAALRLLRGGQ